MISPLQRPVATWQVEEVKIKPCKQLIVAWNRYLSSNDLSERTDFHLPKSMIEERNTVPKTAGELRLRRFQWDSASEARKCIKDRLQDEMERVKVSRYLSRLYSVDQAIAYGYLGCAKVKINDKVFYNKHRTDEMLPNNKYWYFPNIDNPLAKEYTELWGV